MFNYLELEQDDRKKIIKYISEKDYKKADGRISPSKTALRNAFGKTELSRVDYSTLRSYVVKKCVYPGDDIVRFYNLLINKKMSDNVDFHEEIIELVNDGIYSELTEEAKVKIEEYREAYNELEMPFGFDTYIKFLCVSADSSIEKLREETLDQMVKEMEEKINKTQEEYNKLSKDFNEQVKQIRNQNNEIAKLKNENEKYEKLLSLNNVIEKLSDLLPEGFDPQSYKDVYDELNKQEASCYSKNEFDECRRILSAKYAVVKIINHKE